MEEELGSETRVWSRSRVQKLSPGSQVSGAAEAAKLRRAGPGRLSEAERRPGGADAALSCLQPWRGRGCCGRGRPGQGGRRRPPRALGWAAGKRRVGRCVLEAHARGTGDQLAERGFPSAGALSLHQAALRGPLGGPERTAVLAWVGVSSLPPDQKSQEAGLPEALRTPGLLQWSAGLRLDVRKQEVLGWQSGLETSFRGVGARGERLECAESWRKWGGPGLTPGSWGLCSPVKREGPAEPGAS